MAEMRRTRRSALMQHLLGQMQQAPQGTRTGAEALVRLATKYLQKREYDKLREEEKTEDQRLIEALTSRYSGTPGGGAVTETQGEAIAGDEGEPFTVTKKERGLYPGRSMNPDALARVLSLGPDQAEKGMGFLGAISQMQAQQAAAAAPPKHRTRINKEDTIFEEWDSSRRRWVEVSRGKRKDPGTTVNVNPLDPNLDKTVVKDLEKTILASDNQLDLLTEMEEGFDAEFLTLKGQAKAKILEVGEWLGKELTEKQRAYLMDSTTFMADTAENLNIYIKYISGAAVSAQEAERLAIAQPTTEDSPTVYWAKLQSRIKKVKIARARANLARELGITDIGEVTNLANLNSQSFKSALNKQMIKWESDLVRDGYSPEDARRLSDQKARRVLTIGDSLVDL